jgi:hypothetical protein
MCIQHLTLKPGPKECGASSLQRTSVVGFLDQTAPCFARGSDNQRSDRRSPPTSYYSVPFRGSLFNLSAGNHSSKVRVQRVDQMAIANQLRYHNPSNIISHLPGNAIQVPGKTSQKRAK